MGLSFDDPGWERVRFSVGVARFAIVEEWEVSFCGAFSLDGIGYFAFWKIHKWITMSDRLCTDRQ